MPGEPMPDPNSGAVQAAADTIRAPVGDDRGFGALEINPAGDGLILDWHGDPPSTLLADVRATHQQVAIDVQQTRFLPGDLPAAVQHVLRTEVDEGVTAVSANYDGSGLTVYANRTEPEEELPQLARRLSSELGYPVAVEAGGVMPAS